MVGIIYSWVTCHVEMPSMEIDNDGEELHHPDRQKSAKLANHFSPSFLSSIKLTPMKYLGCFQRKWEWSPRLANRIKVSFNYQQFFSRSGILKNNSLHTACFPFFQATQRRHSECPDLAADRYAPQNINDRHDDDKQSSFLSYACQTNYSLK